MIFLISRNWNVKKKLFETNFVMKVVLPLDLSVTCLEGGGQAQTRYQNPLRKSELKMHIK